LSNNPKLKWTEAILFVKLSAVLKKYSALTKFLDWYADKPERWSASKLVESLFNIFVDKYTLFNELLKI
jgi:hypothetical protein